MMPYCEHRRCKRVAEIRLGDRIATGGDYDSKNRWEQVVWLCPKHYKKIMLLLGRDKSRIEKDLAVVKERG